MINTEKLLNELDIKQVIETYTGNQIKHGKTLCPFHNDHAASLSVKTSNGLWRCWACGIGGNAINFTRQFYGLSFIEACKKLSEDFRIDDIGIIEDSYRKRDIWDAIESECHKQYRQYQQQAQAEIDNEITTLTAVHRCLFHLGFYEEAERYAAMLDALQEADLYTSYRLLFGR